MKRCVDSDDGQGAQPQRNQTKLVCGLLLWICLLTISQVMSIALLFISRSDKLRTRPDVGQVNTFEPIPGRTEHGAIRWKTQDTESKLLELEDKGTKLTILHDGTYFLYLQVTQTGGSNSSECEVTMKTTNRVLLEGKMTNISNSTGFLGRAVKLTTPDTLKVTICSSGINTRNSATFLGILLLKNDY